MPLSEEEQRVVNELRADGDTVAADLIESLSLRVDALRTGNAPRPFNTPAPLGQGDPTRMSDRMRTLHVYASHALGAGEIADLNARIGLSQGSEIDPNPEHWTVSPSGVYTYPLVDVPVPDAEQQWEYETTTGPRKAWDSYDVPPEGEGWEPDPEQGRPGESWERFDYHEERYWRRPKPAAANQDHEHNWVDVTRLSETRHHYMCSYPDCPATMGEEQ